MRHLHAVCKRVSLSDVLDVLALVGDEPRVRALVGDEPRAGVGLVEDAVPCVGPELARVGCYCGCW